MDRSFCERKGVDQRKDESLRNKKSIFELNTKKLSQQLLYQTITIGTILNYENCYSSIIRITHDL
jgi:hypothetical protein